MPIPIMPINKENKKEMNNLNDYSFLLNMTSTDGSVKKDNKKTITASDRDAELLMKIWTFAEQTQSGRFRISRNVISDNDFCNLKLNGLVCGGMDCCEFTKRARQVVKVMTLGESNSFLKKRVNKSYNEILANNNIKGKKGYRVSKTAKKNKLIKTTFKITNKQWIKIGAEMGWIK